jgi:hypothetical protein
MDSILPGRKLHISRLKRIEPGLLSWQAKARNPSRRRMSGSWREAEPGIFR